MSNYYSFVYNYSTWTFTYVSEDTFSLWSIFFFTSTASSSITFFSVYIYSNSVHNKYNKAEPVSSYLRIASPSRVNPYILLYLYTVFVAASHYCLFTPDETFVSPAAAVYIYCTQYYNTLFPMKLYYTYTVVVEGTQQNNIYYWYNFFLLLHADCIMIAITTLLSSI